MSRRPVLAVDSEMIMGDAMIPNRSRVFRRTCPGIAALLMVALWRVLSTPVGAAALSPAPTPGSSGYDVSYPQCGVQLPIDGSFAIVGVNAGLPWSTNPCFVQEYNWAASRTYTALYMNTANPAPSSSFYWPESGATDPALCIDSTSTSDPGCAYDYGWHAAESALVEARTALGPIAGRQPWWLDVETTNSWNGDGPSNAADIQGSIDYLRANGVPSVGIYSTGDQWRAISGGYTIFTAATYVSRWSPEFAPLYALAASPIWVAGAPSTTAAMADCGPAFTGRLAQVVQVFQSTLSTDLACTAPTSIPTNVVVPGLASDGQ
jgi:hypothetical protein